MRINDERCIRMRELAKVLLASQGQIDKMSRLQDVFEDDNIYKQTFREGFLNQEPQRLVLLYKTHLMINTVITHTQTDKKFFYAKKAKNLVTALAIQGVLNSALFEKMMIENGHNLKQSADYRDFLRRVGPKIREIFSYTFTKREYKQYFAEEFNPSFLRKDSTFDDCMRTAKKTLRWQDYTRSRVLI